MKKIFTLIFFCLLVLLLFWAPETKALDINPPPLTCQPQDSGEERVSRPLECQPCNLTNKLSLSCATSTTAKDKVSYRRGDGTDEQPHCVERSWGGTVTMDPSQVTIPFVGKKGQEDEAKYLADYLEGTNEYYKIYNYYWLDWVDHAGVLRKLTPMTYQNQSKKDMVDRAQESLASGNALEEGKIHDYKVQYVGRLCWDLPFLSDLFLALIKKLGLSLPGLDFVAERTHYCIFEDNPVAGWTDDRLADLLQGFNNLAPSFLKINYQRLGGVGTKLSELANHLPPDPSEEDYEKKWQTWKNSDGGKWFRLWQATPMVTREDTPGYLTPYWGWRPKDDPIPLDKNLQDEQKIEKVPHVARLYETSKILQGLLVPDVSTTPEISQNPLSLATEGTKVLPASTDTSCGLAAPVPVPPCQVPALTDSNENDTLCCQPIKTSFTAVDIFSNPDYESCRAEGVQCGEPYPCPWNPIQQCQDCHDPCDDMIEQDVQRQFGLNVLHPYLDNIWEQTANAESQGIFNLFRPAGYPKFSDIEAASEISYSYSGEGSIEPTSGQFYFRHLGGVQMGKDWLTRALTPYKP